MNAQNCLAMLRGIRDAAFATVDENGLPQVRMIDVMLAEQQALYFCTARGKAFYRELRRDGHVAVTGMNEKYQMVRLNGIAERLDEQTSWIDRIFKANPSMNEVYPGDSRYVLEAFCIRAGQVEFFDLGVSPIERALFPFGGARAEPKGFFITEACIGCGKCAAACPQKCIAAGSPYRIEQAHCLHCGLCAELCPSACIIKEQRI